MPRALDEGADAFGYLPLERGSGPSVVIPERERRNPPSFHGISRKRSTLPRAIFRLPRMGDGLPPKPRLYPCNKNFNVNQIN